MSMGATNKSNLPLVHAYSRRFLVSVRIHDSGSRKLLICLFYLTMGILSFFKCLGRTTASDQDFRKTVCPNCGSELKKVPVRKTRCPHCRQFMFVRTRPTDRARVIVSEEESKRIDFEWDQLYEARDIEESDYNIEEEKEKLRKTFGQEPTLRDVRWAVLNKQLIKHARRKDWGLYRNARLDMAGLLRREDKLETALETLLEVCFIDLNGPNNCSGHSCGEADWFKPEECEFLAPGVVAEVGEIAKALNLQKTNVGEIYYEHNKNVESDLKLPLSVEESWKKLEAELSYE